MKHDLKPMEPLRFIKFLKTTCRLSKTKAKPDQYYALAKNEAYKRIEDHINSYLEELERYER